MDTDDAPDQHASEHEHAHQHPVWPGRNGAAVSHPHVHPHHAGYADGDYDGHPFAVADVPANHGDAGAPAHGAVGRQHAEPDGAGDPRVATLTGVSRTLAKLHPDADAHELAYWLWTITAPGDDGPVVPGTGRLRPAPSDRLRAGERPAHGGAEPGRDRGEAAAGAAPGGRGVSDTDFIPGKHRHAYEANGRCITVHVHPHDQPGHTHPDLHLGPRLNTPAEYWRDA